jgi:hypothetical protein
VKITDEKAMYAHNAIQALLLTEDGGFATSASDQRTINRLLEPFCKVAWEDDPRRRRALRETIFTSAAGLDLMDHRVQDTVIDIVAEYLAAD